MKTNEMKDIMEFAICSDIASRTALFALARACTKEEISVFYKMLDDALQDGGYEAEKVKPLIEQFRNAANIIRDSYENHEQLEVKI